jgi:methionyl aminopeptidase
MISLKSKDDIEGIRKSGAIVNLVLNSLADITKPGFATKNYDIKAEEIVHNYSNAKCAFKGYSGFPHSVCVSVNEEVVHGFPSARKLHEGDIVSLDFGVVYNGYYADSAITVCVGAVSAKAEELIKTTKEALYIGIEQAKLGNSLSKISGSIENYVLERNFSVVRDFVGHGVGFELHEEPQVPNYFIKNYNITLEEGLVIAIEPMVNEKNYKVKIKKNHWTVVTADGGLSAHFEHTIAITQNGPEILT